MTEWDEVVNSPNPPTIPAPWESLTKALPYRGWRHGKLTLIAARAGDGLTTMGLEAARHASGLGHRVLMFSLRYAPLTMQARMIAAGARIPFGTVYGALEDPAALDELDPAARERFETARRQTANVEVRRPGPGFDQDVFAHEMDQRRPGAPPPGLVVIDSVTAMKPRQVYRNPLEPGENREEMYKDLFFAVRRGEFSMLALTRIPGEPSEKPPHVHDLTEADDRLHGLAAQTLLLHRHRTDGRMNEVDALIHPTEFTPPVTVPLALLPAYPSMVDPAG
ncbi:MAG TPA: DnaB-like helicase C-terminal domain-containing protein [Thermobifida alba]|nr:DnaB-like helicase C-terminal domain-containing protein [Thermobifida alba]